MGATQPVLGVTAGLQDRVLTGMDPGMRGGGQAGNRRGNTHDRLFLPSSDPQAVRGLRPEWAGSGCSLFMQQHFIAQDHPSSPFTPVSHIPCVPPQGGTEELEEDSQCPLPTIPPKVSTLLWAPPCLMQGVTAGEEPPLSSMCPKPGTDSPSQPTQPGHRNYFLGFCSFEVHQI